MITSISIGAKVICTDGSAGRLAAVVADSASRKLTHIAVGGSTLLHGEEKLIPVDLITKTTRDEVYLNCTTEEVSQQASFTRTHYLEVDQGSEGYAYTFNNSMNPDMVVMPPVVRELNIPEGEVAVQRGMAVEALDGKIGKVGELLIDSSTGQVSHFILMKGHGWGKKEIAVPVAMIDYLDEATIHLKVEKEEIGQLPSLPANRDWTGVFANDLELMVWVYEGKEMAQQALDKVQELCKQYEIEIFNATVLEKELNGDTHVHEDKKAPSKGRVALGIALGGLAGLVIGPVALVAGAIAGAVAGKKSAKKVEVGFSEDKLKKLNEALVPGGSALVLLVEHRWYYALQMGLAENGGQLIYERLSDVTADDLMDKASTE